MKQKPNQREMFALSRSMLPLYRPATPQRRWLHYFNRILHDKINLDCYLHQLVDNSNHGWYQRCCFISFRLPIIHENIIRFIAWYVKGTLHPLYEVFNVDAATGARLPISKHLTCSQPELVGTLMSSYQIAHVRCCRTTPQQWNDDNRAKCWRQKEKWRQTYRSSEIQNETKKKIK